MIKILQWGMDKETQIGGVATYLINQFRCIEDTDVHYDFIHILDDPIAFETEIKKRSEVFFLPERRKHPFRYYIALICLFRELSKKGYQGIVMNLGGPAYSTTLLLAKWYGIPNRIAHSHSAGGEVQFSWTQRLRYWINRKILLYSATDLWACSKSAGKWLFHVDGSKVIHNGIDLDDYVYDANVRNRKRAELGIGEKFVLGHVGRFSPVKNHLFLLNLFRLFHEQHPESLLILVGDDKDIDAYDGYFRQIKEYVQFYNMEEDVVFTGFFKETAPFYQAMDVFLLPSTSEGLPFVSIEAQASNLPCLVSTGVPKEVVITDNIRRLSLENIDEWLNELNRIYNKGNVRKSNKQQLVEAGYDVRTTMASLEKYWKELADNHAQG